MQLLDAALIVIPASFFFLMAADFVSGLVALFNSQSLSLEDAAHILSIIDSVPRLEPRIEAHIDEDSEELQYAYLPDPWMLATEDDMAISQGLALRFALAATVPTATPCLRLLPPAKPQIVTLETAESDILATFMPVVATSTKKKAGHPKKNSPLDAEFSANPVAKRKAGRPRKTA